MSEHYELPRGTWHWERDLIKDLIAKGKLPPDLAFRLSTLTEDERDKAMCQAILHLTGGEEQPEFLTSAYPDLVTLAHPLKIRQTLQTVEDASYHSYGDLRKVGRYDNSQLFRATNLWSFLIKSVDPAYYNELVDVDLTKYTWRGNPNRSGAERAVAENIVRTVIKDEPLLRVYLEIAKRELELAKGLGQSAVSNLRALLSDNHPEIGIE